MTTPRESIVDRWEQSNGPWTRATGGAIDAVRHAHRAGWTVEQLVDKVRAQWALIDTVVRLDG